MVETKLKTLAEWYDYIYARYGSRHPSGLMAMEQAAFQSKEHQVCIECLAKDNLVLQDRRGLIQNTDYYMCQDCLDYYSDK